MGQRSSRPNIVRARKDMEITEGFPAALNVGLFGTPGVGKSSFINSLHFALKGRMSSFAMDHSSIRREWENPPGETTEEISDKQLLKIAEKVPGSKLLQLGVHLNIEAADIHKYQQMHVIHGGCRGAWDMLQAWKEKTKAKDQRVQLERALEDAQLGWIADQHIGQLDHIEGEEVSKESTESVDSEIRALEKEEEEVEKLELGERRKRFFSEGAMEPIEIVEGAVRFGDRENLPDVVGFRIRIRNLHQPGKLEERYTVLRRIARRFQELEERNFPPELTRRHGPARPSMENSRHDIFRGSGIGKHGRRLVVSGDNIAKNTALSRILAFDWATQNQATPLSDLFRGNQTIEAAIKQQLFRDLEAPKSSFTMTLRSMFFEWTIGLDKTPQSPWTSVMYGEPADNLKRWPPFYISKASDASIKKSDKPRRSSFSPSPPWLMLLPFSVIGPLAIKCAF